MTTSPVTFRPFTPTDAPACLVLFNSNCPPYFHPSERADFEQFLQDLEDRGDYWVMELSGGLVGCGGVWFGGGGQAGLGWGMVRRDLHGQGLGTRLTAFRLQRLRAWPEVRQIRLDTSQHTEAFYASHGFVVMQRTTDDFASGLDKVKMELELDLR